ncbi:hydrogen gas-evolving membrane-bound hydrogenase subunit E [Pseudobdellovibrio exovorus]|uniref:NADH dehydrogenase n=1 Tax=Pseudobdellovibrio exovorus JSS TaxID=1184267 RepID=M4V8P6_9BACT|nr:hydrogen gas-evolving membrane-bound hydrogenase subunit E [Pseudobdellovibrio exovorus]AGH94386.1 NADH dehydrogenase [Pseudobdellovibrio exovorus JSS]
MNTSSLTQILPVWSTADLSNNFIWDSWSQLFISLIVGIGILVSISAWGYFKDLSYRIKFFSVLLPFAAAMSGVVTFDNLILLFIAWELTSILSFFLITFKGEVYEARRGGQHSLLVTGMGGLSLLGGIILLGVSEGAWTISTALNVDLSANPYGEWIAGLIILGAITKSAQFPFHFWLTGAMTAPTPASAYLHSATMVKAGIYLLYRLWPMLSTIEPVTSILFFLGIMTFGWGIFISLMQLDLKGVLAGTTIAHLGLMVAMIAWPEHDLSMALFALVVSHATYKAGLFLFSGVVEQLAGTRRIDLMSGLRNKAPFVFGIGLILAGASLGLPGTLAYHAKNMIHLPIEWKLALTLGFLVLGKAGMLVAVRPFLGTVSNPPTESSKNLTLMWIPPLILSLFSWLALPMGIVEGTTDWAVKNILMSVGAALIAITLLRKWTPEWSAVLNRGPWPQGDDLFDRIWYTHLDFAKWVRNIVQPRTLGVYVITVMAVFSIGVLWLIGDMQMLTVTWPDTQLWNDVFVWLCLGKIIATFFVMRTSQPILSVLFLGLVGYLFAIVLALAGAPDLAMTQFSVETLSVLVLLYAIKGVGPLKSAPMVVRDFGIVISVLVGIAVTLATGIASLTTQPSRLKDFFSNTSWVEAHGRNVVNVILVDYRALDTLGEITVLGIVALGIYLLLSSVKKGNTR